MHRLEDMAVVTPAFRCERHEDGHGVIRLCIQGELDVATAPSFARALLTAEEEAPSLLLIDLRGLTFLGVAGLRLMLGACTRIGSAGPRVSIVAGPRQVMRIFELTGADHRLEIVDCP